MAKVSKTGKVTGVKAGNAKITVFEAKKKAKKKKKIGTCSVLVKPQKSNTQKKTTAAPGTSAPAATAPGATVPAATAPVQTEPVQTPAATGPAAPAKPTIVPAYNTTTVDFDGSTSKVVESEITVPLAEAML